MNLLARPTGGNDQQILDDEHVASWREAGYTFSRGLLPESLVDELASAAVEYFPEAGSEAAQNFTSFGGPMNFPSTVPAFNAVTLHPRLLGAIAELLDTPVTNLRLTQSDLWPKYGRAKKIAGALDNADQRIHIDYPNHTLAHPAEWSRPEAVELILYLSDIEACGGPTAVVPREGPDDPAYRWPIVDSPGIGDLDYVNDKETAERYFAEQRPELESWRKTLYARERRTHFKPGDVLFYRHDTWHRGTPMHPGTLRLAHNITYRRAECEWISTLHAGWAWSAYRRDKFFERLIATATLEQRAVLGFPQPGSSYWTEATIAAVGARHGPFGMDMTPYLDAMN